MLSGKIYILYESHSRNFACHASKEPAGLFGIVVNHHEIVIDLREDGFNAFLRCL